MSDNKRYWVIILVLLGASAGLYRLSHGEAATLSQPLSAFPAMLDGLQASDIPLQRDVLDVLGVDEYLNRVYQAVNQVPVSLYIGYYRSQRTGASIHSPKNCLPGAGWEPLSAGSLQLALADGRPVAVNLYIVEKGLDRQVVVYWYQSHGRVIASEYWGKIYMVVDAIRLHRTDAALVRIITPVDQDPERSRRRAAFFAQQVLAQVQSLMPLQTGAP